MNDEYLWQKTGEDPEIEKLEQKLAVFRYRETPLPVPSVVKTVETASVPRWRISLAFAFAASVIAALLVAVVFLRTDRNDSDTVFVASPELEIQSAPPPAATEEKKVTPAPAGKTVPLFAHGKRSTSIRTEPARVQRPKTREPRPTTLALTAEEKYAYRQLMLALSVSSSKLKIVEDSIKGTENIENTRTNQR